MNEKVAALVILTIVAKSKQECLPGNYGEHYSDCAIYYDEISSSEDYDDEVNISVTNSKK